MSGKYTGGRIHVAKGEEGGKKIVLVVPASKKLREKREKHRKRDLMACLHGDSGTQVGKVTRLGGVTCLSI